MTSYPSSELVKTALATFWPKKHKQILAAEAEGERLSILHKALAEAEVRAASDNSVENRHEVENLRVAVIAAIAGEDIGPDEAPKPLDPDFRENFRHRASHVTNEEMQKFMAKLLASEVRKPGSIPQRAVNVAADLSREEAETFSNLCRFRWQIGERLQLVIPHEYPEMWELIEQQGIELLDITDMERIGLLTQVPAPVPGFTLSIRPKTFTTAFYFGELVIVKGKGDGPGNLIAGNVMLSRAGRSIAGTVDAEPVSGFFEKCIEFWEERCLLNVVRTEKVPIGNLGDKGPVPVK